MKIEIICLAVGDKFKYNEESPEFELVSFIVSDDIVSKHCLARNLETGFVAIHSCFDYVFIPPYSFSTQLSLF